MKIFSERIAVSVKPSVKAIATAKAERNGTTISLVIRDFLNDYIKGETLKETPKTK